MGFVEAMKLASVVRKRQMADKHAQAKKNFWFFVRPSL